MKKLFLIPLLTLMCSVMAWATDAHVSTIADLNAKLADASIETIYLDNDVTYATNETVIWVKRSVTIDGQNHTISGYGKRGARYVTISIYPDEGTYTDPLNVTLKNIKASHNAATGRSLELFHYDSNVELNIDNCEFRLTGSGNNQGVTVESTHTTVFNISNSTFNANNSGYPLITFSPLTLNLTNSNFAGYCALYFKAGSANSVVNAEACNFDAPNVHSGKSNAFAVFPMEETPMTFNLNNCGMNAEQLGDQGQPVFCLSEWTKDADRAGQVNINISGDNTYINCETEWIWNSYWYPNTTGTPDYNSIISTAEAALHVNVNAQITGGTYSVDPREMIYWNDQYKDSEGYHYSLGHITIPEGYEVKEITTQQGGLQTTLYRVRKEITTSYNINDDAQGDGDGQNDNTEFIISGSSTEQSVGTETVDSVVANYIEVSDNATLTIPEDKVLVVTNGLDVTDGAKVDVKAGSTLIVGEGGVTSENVESIVVEADEQGSASFLLAPEVIVNTTPNITIKMTAKQVGWEWDDEQRDFFWFRFAAPVADIQGFDKDKDRLTYIFKWDYAADDWASISALGEMEPFQGYTLTTNHEGLEDVTYTFKGRLAGNQDIPLKFKNRGYNFFGNSYTGYMDIHALVDQLMNHEAIDGTVYLWDQSNQGYTEVTLGDLAANEPAEVAPMQTFILRQINTAEPIETTVNYASAIWGNPRYGLVANNTSGHAPKRVNNDFTKMTIVVSAGEGKTDKITFKESNEFSDEFNKGFDAVKYMNEKAINLYATIDNENYGSIATNNIEGKLINMQTIKALNYTMTFKNVRGEEYAIRDNETNQVIAIEEGASYEFVAQPNSIVEGRFEIVDRANVVTSIDNAQDNKANVKGIYTIMGQYVGENFDVLPTGVYVVDGVKIVK